LRAPVSSQASSERVERELSVFAGRDGNVSPRRHSESRGFAIFWAAAALSVLALSPLAGRIAAAPLACPFHAVTGIPCPACGSLRAALALARLDFAAALAASPLAAIAWAAFIAGGLGAGIMTVAGRHVREPGTHLSAPARVAIVLALLANWAYLVLRSA
jgi:uncharacterized protein DUF2752